MISSFNPTGGKVGDPVTINGTSFTGATHGFVRRSNGKWEVLSGVECWIS